MFECGPSIFRWILMFQLDFYLVVMIVTVIYDLSMTKLGDYVFMLFLPPIIYTVKSEIHTSQILNIEICIWSMCIYRMHILVLHHLI